MDPSSLFSLSEHLERLSKDGDPLETLDATVDFEYFRGWLVQGLGYGDGSKGGRPPFDCGFRKFPDTDFSNSRTRVSVNTGHPFWVSTYWSAPAAWRHSSGLDWTGRDNAETEASEAHECARYSNDTAANA